MKRQLKYGIFIFLSLVGYYMIMKAFNLHENLWLRGFNFAIVFFWLYRMNEKKKDETKYLRQFGNNLVASVSGVILFSISIFIYLTWINPEFVEIFSQTWMFSSFLSPGLITAAILIEGFASSIILSLIVMQIFKRTTVVYHEVNS